MKILFVSSTRIGDAVLSTGLLDHLIRTHPAARITLACGPVAEGVFARMPNRERTIVLEKRPGGLHWLGLWRQVAAGGWDLVVDLRGSALAWLLPRARRRAVMRGGRRPGHRLTHLAAVLGLDPPPLPVAWYAPADAALAAGLLPGPDARTAAPPDPYPWTISAPPGLPGATSAPSLPGTVAPPGAPPTAPLAPRVPGTAAVEPGAPGTAAAPVVTPGIGAPPQGPWIGLGPTANWDGKVWPPERFVAAFRALAAPDGPLPGARAAVFGGPGEAERAMAAPVLAALPPGAVVDLVGRLALPEAAAALARCALFLGNDSGLMHLAAAAGTPTLGLFGPTPAEEYAPAGRRAAAVLARRRPDAVAAAPATMEDLPVEDVLDAARRLLAPPSSPAAAAAAAPARATA